VLQGGFSLWSKLYNMSDTSEPERAIANATDGVDAQLFPVDLKHVIEYAELYDRVMDFTSSQYIIDVRPSKEYA
jgi:3-mercaptopyruvate sulfurtransferase SseA